jgi:2-isopropylmalate synthase
VLVATYLSSLGLGQRPRVKPSTRSAASLQLSAAEGNGPVDALNKALREPLEVEYPQLRQTDLADYRVRLLESDFSGRSASDSASTTRVTIDFEDESGNKWTTVGAHTSIVEASFRALVDGLEFGIINCDDVSRCRSESSSVRN